MFITFEGIDGSGKTTQLQLLKNALEARGRTVIATREPGGTRVAELLRELLLHGREDGGESLDARAELLLFGAARAQHVAQIIRPALERGDWVLCDRFGASSEAYQGALGLDRDFIRTMNSFATAQLTPNLTFFLDVAPQIGLERRLKAERGNEDRIEARGLAFQEQVRAIYLQIAAREAAFVTLDASISPEQLHEQVWERVGVTADG